MGIIVCFANYPTQLPVPLATAFNSQNSSDLCAKVHHRVHLWSHSKQKRKGKHFTTITTS